MTWMPGEQRRRPRQRSIPIGGQRVKGFRTQRRGDRVYQFYAALHESASLIGRLGSSAFRLFTTRGQCHSRARASLRNRHQGPSIMGAEDEAEQSLGRPCHRQVQADSRTHLIHRPARDTISTRLVELEFAPVVIGSTWLSCRCGFSGPAELGAVNPDAVQNHGQPSRQRDNRSFHPAALGNLHSPSLEP
jgi:hypothetical protein